MSGEPASDAVLCAGRVYCDLVFTGVPNLPTMGTETFSEGLSLHAGGGAFITAAVFSALGWESSLLTTLPSAPFDAVVCDDIAKFGIGTQHCIKAVGNTSPQITVAIAGTDDRAFLSHKSGNALPETVIPKDVFRHLHVGELRSLLEHPDLIDKARGAGMTISVDCGWDAEILTEGAKLATLLSKVDVFLPNETEHDHLINSGLPEGAAPLTVVKCGGNGAQALFRGTWLREKATRATVIDATGAGDAFNGGFLSSWLSGKTLSECLETGNRCGHASVEKSGGTSGLSNLQSDLAKDRIGAAS